MVKIYLYDLIQSRGWTQKQLALETSIREATISNMCNNASKVLSVVHLSRICKALNCKIEDLLEYIPDNPKNN